MGRKSSGGPGLCMVCNFPHSVGYKTKVAMQFSKNCRFFKINLLMQV